MLADSRGFLLYAGVEMDVRRTILTGALAVALLATLSFSAFALNPRRVIAQYGHDIWLRRNGLPSNAVNVCLQTRDGYLWVGTSAGLFRYDGEKFLEVTTDSSSKSSSETISSLFESAEGNLWIGTLNSWLCLFTKGNIRRIGETLRLEREHGTCFSILFPGS
jgi:ligand-binding sensor domain-containing protein